MPGVSIGEQSLRDAHMMSPHSGSHWLSSFETYGRWKYGNDQPLGSA